jgi:hypothetical protein
VAPWGDDVLDFGGYLTQRPPLKKTLEAYFTFFGHYLAYVDKTRMNLVKVNVKI